MFSHLLIIGEEKEKEEQETRGGKGQEQQKRGTIIRKCNKIEKSINNGIIFALCLKR